MIASFAMKGRSVKERLIRNADLVVSMRLLGGKAEYLRSSGEGGTAFCIYKGRPYESSGRSKTAHPRAAYSTSKKRVQ